MLSALGQGFYEVSKKVAVTGNNVLIVLTLNTVFAALLMSPVIVEGCLSGHELFGGSILGCLLLMFKAAIVLASWAMGYASIKLLPLTVAGTINATRPVVILAGGMLIFGEHLSVLQWAGMILGFVSFYSSTVNGAKDGFSLRNSRGLWLAIGSMLAGATSGLYDKFLLQRFEPTEVQAWYQLFQCLMMCVAAALISRKKASQTPFRWHWAILLVPVFHTFAEFVYYHALSYPNSMISIVAMIQRGSVIVTFVYGAIVLHEKNVKSKLVDLALLFLGLVLIIAGSD